MASNDSLDGVPGKWPPTEYYEVRRPMEEWVPPLEMLEEMKRDEPHRFSSHDHAHESRCLMLYHSGKSREEVFQEVSRMLSKEEVREDPPQQMNDDFDSGDDSCSNVSLPRVILDSGISSGYNAELKRQFGLLPSLKEERVYQEKSAGGFRVLTGTSQGSRFDVPPKEWIEDELIAVGARSELTHHFDGCFGTDEFSRASGFNTHTRSSGRDSLCPQTRTMAWHGAASL